MNTNYFDKIPCHSDNIKWSVDNNGIVILETENTGFFKQITQKLLKKPKKTYIHLDVTGSYIWKLIDGNKTIIELSKMLEKQFGENAHPLYERLIKYFSILDSYHFIKWNM